MNDEKRILLIMPYGSVGGMERLAMTFYKYYSDNNMHVKGLKLIKLPNDIINFGKNECYLKNKDFADMSKWQRLFFYLTAPLSIRKIIKKEKITHSIAFGDMANVFSSLTFTNEYKIGSIHALKSVEFKNNTILNRIFKKCYRTTYKNLNKLVCISHAIKDDLIKNCGYKFISNLEIIYNPHDLKEIERLSKEEIESDREKEIFENDVILFLGRLSTQKAPWHLVKSFYLIKQTNPKAKLVFIGDGDERVLTHLEQLIEDLKIEEEVFFLGRKSNPYKYLKNATILALSSHYEGTPNVIAEAICLSTPIVTSNCTKGIGEMMSIENKEVNDVNLECEAGIITPNLYKGILGIPQNKVEITDEERKFAEALTLVLSSDKYKERIKLKREELLDKFNLDVVARKYLDQL